MWKSRFSPRKIEPAASGGLITVSAPLREIDDADRRRGVAPLVQQSEPLHHVQAFEANVLAVRDERAPVVPARRGERRPEHGEVLGVVVGQHEDLAGVMFDRVLDALTALLDDARLALGVRRPPGCGPRR